jgi:D-serine deaminase-like pyridoxal phosphate-dependent protein
VHIEELQTPALIVDADVFDHNLAAMVAVHPGRALRPHVKAHKCTPLAAAQVAVGHDTFTCATPREVVGMASSGVGSDLLLANETLDDVRLRAMADLDVPVTVAVDSDATIAAAARNGLDVRGVMGYEGHLMMVPERAERLAAVEASMALLRHAHDDVGGEIVSAGGTGTFDLHGSTGITELQAGSYALMDTHYGQQGLPFEQALFVIGTVISVSDEWAVADVGLKALGMDHGNPSVVGGTVWFCSDEHLTYAPTARPSVGDRVRVVPAHVDPTMAMHDALWLVRGDEVIDRWPIDLRGW